MTMIDVFKLRDIQNFLALLNDFEGEGVTDIRVVRERLQTGLAANRLQERKERGRIDATGARVPRGAGKIKGRTCPSCLRDRLTPADNDGLQIWACRSCRYSEVVD